MKAYIIITSDSDHIRECTMLEKSEIDVSYKSDGNSGALEKEEVRFFIKGIFRDYYEDRINSIKEAVRSAITESILKEKGIISEEESYG